MRWFVDKSSVARQQIYVFAVQVSQSAERVSKHKPSVFSIPAPPGSDCEAKWRDRTMKFLREILAALLSGVVLLATTSNVVAMPMYEPPYQEDGPGGADGN